MKFYSTSGKTNNVFLKEALFKGLADDGGLFMPEKIMPLFSDFFVDDIPESELKKIIAEAINFPAPLVHLSSGLKALELWHGPTLSFKDFGARFLARLLAYFTRGRDEKITVLVATSGDTGSAVASGFLGAPGIRVIILYPEGKVSKIQEQQLTTMGGNVTAMEVAGTFDDCQKLVKQAFGDEELKSKLTLTSANSINIGRLLAQALYYFEAFAQLEDKAKPIVFSVPSGNLGNLTAGLMAKRMGLPVDKFIAATNSNNTFTEYLNTGKFIAKPSVSTISNAMDVGNPNNFVRVMDIYQGSWEAIKNDIWSAGYSDAETCAAIKEVFEKYNYTLDPHGAVAYLGLKSYQAEHPDVTGIFLATAHPAKFADVVEPVIRLCPEGQGRTPSDDGVKVEIPERLLACLKKEKQSIKMSTDFSEFREVLLK